MSAIYILWLRELKRYVRSRAQIVASLGQPLLYLLVLGFGLGPVFQKAGNGSYLQFVAPGVISMTILFTAIFSGIAMLFDRQFGFLKETLVAPVPLAPAESWTDPTESARRVHTSVSLWPGSRAMVAGAGPPITLLLPAMIEMAGPSPARNRITSSPSAKRGAPGIRLRYGPI